MSNRFWPEGRVSIVLLPSGEQGESLLALAAEWTRTGLLGPALWVLPEHVGTADSAPPKIQATVLGLGHDLAPISVDAGLFKALAEEPLSLVRLVKLRSAHLEREIDVLQDAIAGRVREYVRKSMPMVNPQVTAAEQTTELTHVTLICAPTEFTLSQRVDWASSEYGVVVIASPEDRSSPWSGDAFIRDDERFIGFTLMHLASVAGLWSGTGRGSFELLEREQSGLHNIWISRVFVNAILTDSLSTRMAARVLVDAARPDSLLVDPTVSPPPAGTAFIPEGMVSGYIDGMVDGALSLDGRRLDYHPATSASLPERYRVSVWRVIGSFLKFSGDKLVAVPKWAWRWMSSRTYRSLTRALHTDDGTTVVGPDMHEVLDVRDSLMLTATQSVAAEHQRARGAAMSPANIAHVRTTPRLWSRLRELVFGSLDGSADLAEVGFVPIEESVPIFGRVSDVLALPESQWRISLSEGPDGFPDPVDWYTIALDDPRRRLEHWIVEAKDARDVIAAELDGARALAVLVAAPVTTAPPTAPPAPPAPGSMPVADAAAAGDPATTPPTEAEVKVEQFERALESLERVVAARTWELQSFDTWSQSQNRSFIWRLLDRLSDRRRAADDDLRGMVERLDQVAEHQPGALLRMRQHFHTALLLGWSIPAVVAARAPLAGLTNSPPVGGLPWWAFAAGAGVAALVVTFISLIAYHASWSKFQRSIDVRRAETLDLGHRARETRQEVERLRSLHRQTVDWLVLMSKAIHKPWDVQEGLLDRSGVEGPQGERPFALQIATIADEENAATQRMRAAMTSKLVAKGWRHDAFEALVRETAIAHGAPAELGLLALDEDLPHAANHTRAMLLASLDNAELLERVAAPRLRDLVRAAQEDEQRGARPRVRVYGTRPLDSLRRVGSVVGAGDLGWDEFLLGSLVVGANRTPPMSPTSLEDLQLRERHHEKVESWIVMPSRLETALAESNEQQIRRVSYTADSAAPVDLVWRVDLVGPIPRDAISLWNGIEAVVTGLPGTSDDEAPDRFADRGV